MGEAAIIEAHYNLNPKDNTSPYWKILYKPTSYWQK